MMHIGPNLSSLLPIIGKCLWVHRSFVVKKDAIASVESELVKLQDGKEIPVSRKYRDLVNMIW